MVHTYVRCSAVLSACVVAFLVGVGISAEAYRSGSPGNKLIGFACGASEPGAAVGIFKTYDGGVEWFHTSSGLPSIVCEQLIVVSERLVFARFGSLVYRSDDGARTWNLHTSGAVGIGVSGTGENSNRQTICILKGIKLLCSDDALKWNEQKLSKGDHIAISRVDIPATGRRPSTTEYCVISPDMKQYCGPKLGARGKQRTPSYWATRQGVKFTWLASPRFSTAHLLSPQGCSPSAPPRTKFAASGVPGANIYYTLDFSTATVSKNAGSGLVSVTKGLSGHPLALAALSRDRVLVATTGGLFVTQDEGWSWNPTKSRPENTEVNELLGINATTVLAATNDGVFLSLDGGESWPKTPMSGTKSLHSFRFLRLASDKLLLATASGALSLQDLKSPWQSIKGTTGRSVYQLATIDGGRVLAATDRGVLVSDTTLQAWATAQAGLHPLECATPMPINACAFQPRNKVIDCFSTAGMFRSKDGGRKWRNLHSPLVTGPVFGVVKVKETSGSHLLALAGNNLRMYRSLDADGNDWIVDVDSTAAIAPHLTFDEAYRSFYGARMYADENVPDMLVLTFERNVPNTAGVQSITLISRNGTLWSKLVARYRSTNDWEGSSLAIVQKKTGTGNTVSYYSLYNKTDPNDRRVETSVIKRSDDGVTWREMSSGLPAARSVLATEDGTLYARADRATFPHELLYVSKDGGWSWSKLYNRCKVYDLNGSELSGKNEVPAEGPVFYDRAAKQIVISTEQGLYFYAPISSCLILFKSVPLKHVFSVDFQRVEHFYWSADTSIRYYIAPKVERTATFPARVSALRSSGVAVQLAPKWGDVRGFCHHPSAPKTIFVAGSTGLFRSTPDGISWEAVGY